MWDVLVIRFDQSLLNLIFDRLSLLDLLNHLRDHRGRGSDRVVVLFTTTHTISVYHHYEFDSRSCRGAHNNTLWDVLVIRFDQSLFNLIFDRT
jgi:hypothetical protein